MFIHVSHQINTSFFHQNTTTENNFYENPRKISLLTISRVKQLGFIYLGGKRKRREREKKGE